MNIQVKKLRKNRWELRLIPPDEYVIGATAPQYNDINEVRIAVEEMHRHDNTVKLLNDELVDSDFTMWSRQAYDRWHWYDKEEMDRFITYFTLKHGK